MRAAATDTLAASMRPVASRAAAMAATVASHPVNAHWSRIMRSSARRSGFSSESMCSRRPSGTAKRTRLLTQPPAFAASTASWLAGSHVSVGPVP